MQIERVIQEIQPWQRVEKAAVAVHEWQSKNSKLREDISTAEAALAESQHRRQAHVLEAALGDHDAKSRLAEVLQADREAERRLTDLQLALPAALERLRAVESEHRAAEVEVRKADVNRLARERVAAAADIDKAFADFSKAWANYEALGKQLFSAAADYHPNPLSLGETFDGMARLSAALPHQPFYDLRHRHSFAPIGTSSSLAAAESAYWRLPPAEAVKAA